jgi:hypothetical protein
VVVTKEVREDDGYHTAVEMSDDDEHPRVVRKGKERREGKEVKVLGPVSTESRWVDRGRRGAGTGIGGNGGETGGEMGKKEMGKVSRELRNLESSLDGRKWEIGKEKGAKRIDLRVERVAGNGEMMRKMVSLGNVVEVFGSGLNWRRDIQLADYAVGDVVVREDGEEFDFKGTEKGITSGSELDDVHITSFVKHLWTRLGEPVGIQILDPILFPLIFRGEQYDVSKVHLAKGEEVEKYVFPYNDEARKHWVLIVADVKKLVVYMEDSVYQSGYLEKYRDLMVLVTQMIDDLMGRQGRLWSVLYQDGPRQNGLDCGVFVTFRVVNLVLEAAQSSLRFEIDKEWMSVYRVIMMRFMVVKSRVMVDVPRTRSGAVGRQRGRDLGSLAAVVKLD